MRIPPLSRGFASNRTHRFLLQSLGAASGIALLTYCGFVLGANLTTISSLYLLAVVALASLCGFWQATLTSLVAVACLDYFFMPPLLRFNVSDLRDWVTLGTFETTALVISRLSTREHRSTKEAAFHRSGMEKLYELSGNSLLLDLRQPPGPQLAALIYKIFGVKGVTLFDKALDREDKMGNWTAAEQCIARTSCLRNDAHDDREAETSQRILRAGSGSVGALVVRGELNPLLVDSLATLSAIAIDRHHSFKKEEKADAARKGEELRAAVMDALAHEIKQPLTTIQGASSGLLELGGLTGTQLELVTMIDDEVIRLNELSARLLLTAKLESKEVRLKTDQVDVGELVTEVLNSRSAEEVRSRIEVVMEEPLTVRVDRGLLAMILTQYIDNARKYSAPDTPIKIGARRSHSELLISVRNVGSMIRIEDRERIFDRFYRGPDTEHSVPGTGIGLSVVKKAAEALHGHVWVISDEKEGTAFFLSLPIDGRRKQ
jgi:two-component system, OmpR family, sensor histidine kinase KdpD